MKAPRSLQARLGLSLGILVTLLWLAAAALTSVVLRQEMDQVFDSSLQEAAQRILPLAVVDIVSREEGDTAQRLGAVDEHDEFLTYIVRNEAGEILLQSHAADSEIFPPYDGPGFLETRTHRIYSDEALQGTVRISVAEPLSHRSSVAWEILLALGLPLLVLTPLALLAVVLVVRASLAPLRRFRQRLEMRNARDLSALSADGLPTEMQPIAATLNGLLERLKSAFEAERSFAANAAHELRTPLAGAIAQAQRLQSETSDDKARERASEIEASLKRLTGMSERLLQLARAEGGPLRLDKSADLRVVAEVILADLARLPGAGRLVTRISPTPLVSDLDPDAFAIVLRNLVENALRHGSPSEPIDVALEADGTLRVASEGPVVPADTLERLAVRFERGGSNDTGTGLGLAIVAAIAERISSRLVLQSPRPGKATGFEASIRLPLA